jgi:hypothetical protein
MKLDEVLVLKAEGDEKNRKRTKKKKKISKSKKNRRDNDWPVPLLDRERRKKETRKNRGQNKKIQKRYVSDRRRPKNEV